MRMSKKIASLLGHVGLGAGTGALLAEFTGIKAIGWLGSTCGGVAAWPLFVTLGGLQGLKMFLKRKKSKQIRCRYVKWRDT